MIDAGWSESNDIFLMLSFPGASVGLLEDVVLKPTRFHYLIVVGGSGVKTFCLEDRFEIVLHLSLGF